MDVSAVSSVKAASVKSEGQVSLLKKEGEQKEKIVSTLIDAAVSGRGQKLAQKI